MCFSVREFNNVADVSFAGAAATLPAGAVQCPIEHPFSKYGANSQTVEACCKCQSRTKCKAAAGATHYNIGGTNAMMQPNDVIDVTSLMCGYGCSDTEECRYDKENCEYKCYVKGTVVTTPYNFDLFDNYNLFDYNLTICDICDIFDIDLYNQKGSSVAARLSMALFFAIYSFSD